MFLKCSRNVLEMFSKCSRNVLEMFSKCSRNVLEMFSKCSRNVLEMFSKCSRNVLEMFSKCSRNVLEMFSKCSRNVLEMYLENKVLKNYNLNELLVLDITRPFSTLQHVLPPHTHTHACAHTHVLDTCSRHMFSNMFSHTCSHTHVESNMFSKWVLPKCSRNEKSMLIKRSNEMFKRNESRKSVLEMFSGQCSRNTILRKEKCSRILCSRKMSSYTKCSRKCNPH